MPEDSEENAEESPERERQLSQATKIKQGEELTDALKRALHVSDRDLLKEVLRKNKALARYQIDPAKNVQALHKACQSNDPNIVSMLLDFGAEIDCQDSKLWTPLMIACMHGHFEVVNCLQKRGANLGLED